MFVKTSLFDRMAGREGIHCVTGGLTVCYLRCSASDGIILAMQYPGGSRAVGMSLRGYVLEAVYLVEMYGRILYMVILPK